LKPDRALFATLTLLAATTLPLAQSPAQASTARALGASADSATRVSWVLPNGTHVLAQHVPEAQAISISVAYPGGSDQDPEDRPGLALLLAELQFTSAAGAIPERRRDELQSLRPAGADIHVGRCFTVLTEVATAPQFPVVLQQVIARMHGTQPDAATLAAALETVSLLVKQKYRGAPDVALYNELTERAAGVDDAGMARAMALDGIRKLTPAELSPMLARAFPAHEAVISIAGNLTGFNLHALVDHSLDGLPAGARRPLPAVRPSHAAAAIVTWPGLARPVGALGVIAPSISDSTHPAFFLVSLILGAKTGELWGNPEPPLYSQFQYSVLEDPDMVRFYPPLQVDPSLPNVVAMSFNHTLGDDDNMVISDVLVEKLRGGIAWLLGAPLTDTQLDRMRVNITTLILCSTQMCERELRGGEAFWSVYRRRLEEAGAPDLVFWLARLRNPKYQVQVLLKPA
jgi:hypothetical protein